MTGPILCGPSRILDDESSSLSPSGRSRRGELTEDYRTLKTPDCVLSVLCLPPEFTIVWIWLTLSEVSVLGELTLELRVWSSSWTVAGSVGAGCLCLVVRAEGFGDHILRSG